MGILLAAIDEGDGTTVSALDRVIVRDQKAAPRAMSASHSHQRKGISNG